MPGICNLVFERGFFDYDNYYIFSTAHDEYSLYLLNGAFWSIGWVLSGRGPFLCFLFSPRRCPGWLKFDSYTILTQRKGTMKWYLNSLTELKNKSIYFDSDTIKKSINLQFAQIVCNLECKSWPTPGGYKSFSGTTKSSHKVFPFQHLVRNLHPFPKVTDDTQQFFSKWRRLKWMGSHSTHHFKTWSF